MGGICPRMIQVRYPDVRDVEDLVGMGTSRYSEHLLAREELRILPGGDAGLTM